jgi:hypothetical protein
MAQRIKVQDGRIVYESTDTSYDISMDVKGQMNVTKELNVGDDPLADGVISTPDDSPVDLIITTNTDGFSYGNIRLQPTPNGNILLNNVSWPDGSVTPTPGMFIGSSNVNELQFYSFTIGVEASDYLSESNLNLLYPNAQPGQSVLGPSVIYYCAASNIWRTLGAIDSAVPYYIPNNSTYVVYENKQALYNMPITIDGDLIVDGFLIEV